MNRIWGHAIPVVAAFSLCLVLFSADVAARPSLGEWCCDGWVGDVDLSGAVDITDVSVLIDHMFLTLTPLDCWGEADIDLSYSIDIVDLGLLVKYFSFEEFELPDCPPPPGEQPAGSLTSQTGCKTWSSTTATDPVTADQSCIVWNYNGIGTLALSHINAGFNCCPTLDVTVDVAGGTITLREVETLGECHCLCLFDLEFEVLNLPPGGYRIIAEEPYVDEGMNAVDFIVDLSQTPQGVHCVERTTYPWDTYE
ncbi:MAG: hypothetical protein GY867_09755 [bacterium]|nr:hypothetical protein [bacterium]